MSEDLSEIMRALINQVTKAADGDVERNVITFITRPMWVAWCRAVGSPEDSEPTDWLGIDKTHRVYGSKTIVIEKPGMESMSFKCSKIVSK